MGIQALDIRPANSLPDTQWRAVREWGLVALVLGSVLYSHTDAIRSMVHLWNVSPMYSYGYMVPLISVYLLWTLRRRLAELTPAPDRLAGMCLLAGSLGAAAAGRAGGVQVLEQLALPVSLAGAVLLIFGRGHVRAACVPLVYLLLMIPIWDGVTDPLHAPFQDQSAAIGLFVLRSLGIPAFRDGTFLALPGLNIEVARACSGVNYLVAVVALGIPLAYVYLNSFWRRATLLGSALVVAVLSNGLRVALIGVLAYFDIGSPLHGPFHVLHGLFVAAAGYVVLFVGIGVLRAPELRSHPHRGFRAARSSKWAIVPRREAAVVVLLSLAAGTAVRALEPGGAPHEASLRLPLQLGPWQGEILGPSTESSPLWPGADAALFRRYRLDGGSVVDLQVTYFARQSQDRELASFRTADLHRRAARVALRNATGGSDANLVIDSNGRPEALFWYDVGGKVQTSQYLMKAHTLWRSVVQSRSDAMGVLLAPARGATATTTDLLELAGRVRAGLQAVPASMP